MSTKPDTYIDGAGRVKCSTCGDESKAGICDCNRRWRKGTAFFEIGEPFWKIGEEIDVRMIDSKALYKVRIAEILIVQWDTDKRLGVLVQFGYTIIDVLDPGAQRPKLKLIK